MFLIALFSIFPIIWGFILSLQKASLISPTRRSSASTTTRTSRATPVRRGGGRNAVVYTRLFVPTSIIIALFLAIALNQKIRLIRFYRLAVFIPVAVSTIATGVMFMWVFDANFGLANWALGGIGLGPFGWFDSPQGAMPSLVIMTIWGWLGFDAIIYLAALQGVPHELVEAAAVDGASRLTIFRRVTLPLLGPATLLLVVWSTISAVQLFDEVFFITRGGPLGRTTCPCSTSTSSPSRRVGAAGYAAALAYVLFVVILILTLVQFWLGNRVVHYSS